MASVSFPKVRAHACARKMGTRGPFRMGGADREAMACSVAGRIGVLPVQ